MIPHIRLHGHKKLANIGCLAVVEVGHHPFDVLDGRGVHFTEAAVRDSRLQYGICVRAGTGRPGEGIQVRRRCVMIAEAAIHAVHELTVHKRRAVAVWGTVGEQTGAPICLIGGNFEAGTRVRRGKSRSRQQAQDCHQRQKQ